MARVQFDEIKHLAQARIAEVLLALGVALPRRRSNFISICNPVVKDRHPSFTIWLAGAGIGAFKDHRGLAAGDVIDLVAYLKGWSLGNDKRGRLEALEWLTDLLGIRELSPARQRELAASARRKEREQAAAYDADLTDKQQQAFRMWRDAAPIAGTAVEAYLRARCIDPAELPLGPRGGDRRPHAVRALADHLHRESSRRLPVMIAACVDPNAGVIEAVHRTWLKPDGSGKADVTPVKKVWPAFAGLVIPIWRGASRLRLAQANAECEAHGVYETLVLTEGIEDALSAALAAPQFRVWAFISLGNLRNIRLPRCVDSVIVHRQTEWENLGAGEAFERGVRALTDQGRPVHELEAFIGKDLNDTRRGSMANDAAAST